MKKMNTIQGLEKTSLISQPLIPNGSLQNIQGWTRNILLAFASSLVLFISAKIQIPFYPVPMTMQTYAILVLCVALGRIGIWGIGVYLLEGLAGLPVFAGTPAQGMGITYMFGPTGGYLVGFIFAALILNYGVKKGWDKTIMKCFFIMSSAICIIYLLGFTWLSKLIGIEKAWKFGIEPFILGDILKVILAIFTVKIAWHFKNKLIQNKNNWS